MDLKRLCELANVPLKEKYEEYTQEQLIDELWGELQNLQHFIPESREQFMNELNKNIDTYNKIAHNIIDATSKMRK